MKTISIKLKNLSLTLFIIINIFLIFFFKLFYIKKKKISNTPNISIFLPIYNKENYLNRSLGSIQNQTLKNIEIIAINDGSTDNTLKILKKLSKKDIRIKIINNDRNHGLLYSRAMGILNSTGKYVMNLDPDDKFNDYNCLEELYNKTEKNKIDLIIFLIKRISTNIHNKNESYLAYLENKFQLQRDDLRITNKLIKKEIIMKAYKLYSNNIYKNKWNFHEDNIWNILVRKFSKTSEILNKFIYIYKRNKDSLNMKKGNIIDIKNRIYRLKWITRYYRNIKKKLRYFYNLYFYLENIIFNCNASFLNDKHEIKKGITYISLELLYIFKNKAIMSKNINNILNIISSDKIIYFYNSFNKTLINYLNIFSIFKLLLENNNKIIISIDINNDTKFDNIFNYIYPSDILIGKDDIIFHKNFCKLTKHYFNNKIVILTSNIYINKTLSNLSNLIIHSFNENLIFKNLFKYNNTILSNYTIKELNLFKDKFLPIFKNSNFINLQYFKLPK